MATLHLLNGNVEILHKQYSAAIAEAALLCHLAHKIAICIHVGQEYFFKHK